jgi:predicted nucleotidyltransferase
VSSTTARDYTQGTTTSTSDWKTTLNEIVRRVLSVARPDRIILFGSAATGQMTRDSDIDLLVIEPALANTHERRVEIRDAVGDVG